MNEEMRGKVALVAGASSGIGRATAELFAARGASVVLASRREKELANIVESMRASGGTANFVRADVTKEFDVEAMVAFVLNTYGRIDICANAAGGGEFAPVVDLTEAAWDSTLNVNLKGAFLCIKHAARAMLKAGNGGAIVNVGSISSFLGMASGSAYCAAKHGMIGLTSSASAELAPHGIRVNMVCPSIVDTPMHHQGRALLGDAVFDEVVIPAIHLRRIAQPSEIARSIAYLCGNEASFVTGTTLTIDGGGTNTV